MFNRVVLVDEKNKVPVPDKFIEIMKFTFDKKIISYKILKGKYTNLTDET